MPTLNACGLALSRCAGHLAAAVVILGSGLALVPGVAAGSDPVAERFEGRVRPILEEYCYGCHGHGTKKGKVDLEGVNADEAGLHDRGLWWGVLKHVRAGLMPPAGKPRPSDDEQARLAEWIKYDAFGIDPADPDPGRVTVRRLNRVEYRNTIRDLLGVDYDVTSEFPPDDTGQGFDNNGDVLTLSPLLLEKYLAAASAIIARAVPMVSRVAPEQVVPGERFVRAQGESKSPGPRTLSYYEAATAAAAVSVAHDGRYKLILDLTAGERYVDGVNDYNRCRLVFRADGQELARRDFARQEGKPFQFEAERDWKAGRHTLAVEILPLTPGEKQVRSLSLRIVSATIRGPQGEQYGTRPANYERFFPGEVPGDAQGRKRHAREILGRFAERAFRRPVDDATKDRLAALAESVWRQKGSSFESGMAQAMTAVLTSPRFLFREEAAEPALAGRHPLVDEYALASRLSYFLWSSMPDDELVRLAGEHKLRDQLHAQVDRMLANRRSEEFVRNFVGQWLQARDIESVIINTFAVVARDAPPNPEAERRRARFRELNRKPTPELTDAELKELREIRASFPRMFRGFREFELTGDLRRAMRRETEMAFEHVVQGNRSLLELLDADYTFLNERLAKYYGIEGVKGDEMRQVPLPKGSPRGGVLTQGTILAVTSNPDRTSPVKRGLFILDNILGMPPPPPPPNIPALEVAGKGVAGRTPTLRESMVLHRASPSCMACHSRLDPPGLALENFNALGRWRDNERTQPVDATGKLATGESFHDVRDLKRILVERHRRDFHRCLSEKLLTYALGRGLEAIDVEAVDAIVARIEREQGRARALLLGVIESGPFQKIRRPVRMSQEELSDQSAVHLTDPNQ